MSFDIFIFACENGNAAPEDIKKAFGPSVSWENDKGDDGMEGQTDSGAVFGCDMENGKVDSIVCNRVTDEEIEKVYDIMKKHHFFMMNLGIPFLVVANEDDVRQIPEEHEIEEEDLPSVVAETFAEFLEILESA